MAATAAAVLRRRRRITEGEKDREAQGTHHESIPAVGSSGGRPERRFGGGARFKRLQWCLAMVGAIPAGEKPDWGFLKVEEVPRKVPVRVIEVWWLEEGDRRKGATTRRADELRLSLVEE